MPGTEVLLLPLKPGTAQENAVQAIAAVPAVQNVYFGSELDNPDTLVCVINWDSIQAQKDYIASEPSRQFLDYLRTLLAGKPSVHMLNIQPSTEAQFKTQEAPITEIAIFNFNGNAAQEAAVAKALEFRPVVSQQPGFVELVAGATTTEEEIDGQKARAVIVLIGWQAKENYIAIRDSEKMKNDHPFREFEHAIVKRTLLTAKLQKWAA